MKTKFRFATKLISLILMFSLILCSLLLSPYALDEDDDAELKELQQQYEDIEKEIQKNKAELNEVQSDIKDNKKRLSTINNEISGINNQINILENRISTLDNKIDSIEKNIESTNKTIEDLTAEIEVVGNQIIETQVLMQDTRESLLGRIRENYMAGESSTLEILFSSEDISSFFTRKELISRVSENDAALINDLSNKIKELNELQTKLENDKAELENKKVELAEQKEELGDKQTDLESSIDSQESKKKQVTSKKQEVVAIINELDKDSEEYKTEIKKQEAEKEELNRKIDAYIQAHGSKAGDTPSSEIVNDGKMSWPVHSASHVTAGYPAYSNGSAHWGIDIVLNNGKTRGSPFYAAQGGKVLIAVNDGNWNYGFGNYCVIDHGDGKMTLYAHSDNIQCYVGQIVEKGQQIGIIGATGNVTGPHLHFEVRIKNADGSVSRVQPLNYVSNPY